MNERHRPAEPAGVVRHMTRFVEGHSLQLLEGGDAYFAAIEGAFERATLEIHVQSYIFADDVAGRRVAAALMRAAARGVAVYVLIDGFGGRTMPHALRETLRRAGVDLQFFRPQVSVCEFQRSRLRRLHHKIVVVDGVLGFVGGINLIDDMHTPGHTPPRWDYAVQVRGPALADLLALARQTWERVTRTYR
ncbi:MAG: cardiolipin synthase ClsB, partial [Proteobacteria bacterium]|nr:cardiolipin synthase ClsB [Burkholderiales bacterium]